MMPIFVILAGILLAFYGSIKLLKFLGDFSLLMSELNALYGSDAFEEQRAVKAELDELNYSYYEILDLQDKRISDLEIKLLGIDSKTAKLLSGVDLNLQQKSYRKQGSFNETDTGSERSSETLNSTSDIAKEDLDSIDITKKRVLSLYEKGMGVQDIAETLNVDIGTVDLLCSLFGCTGGN